MSNIIPFNAAQRLATNAKLAEQQRREDEEAGNDAWGRLQKARKLKADDRIEIAKAMHKELEKLKQQRPKIPPGKLAEKARFPNSKELYRLTLPPGEDPSKRGLRAEARKYTSLLKAIQGHTHENIKLMADRLTWATSFHPKQTLGKEESEQMMNVLGQAIIRIDHEFAEASGGERLFETFMKTARIKTDMAKQGGRLRWPYYDFDPDSNYNDTSSQEDYPEFGPGDVIPNMPQDYIPRPEDDFDPKYAYWQRDYCYANRYSRESARGAYGSDVAHHDALMFLPRIYLGVVDSDSYFIPTVDEEEANRQYAETHTVIQFEAEPGSHQRKIERLKSCVGELGEIRDPVTGHAHIAHRHPKTGEWMPGLSRNYGRKFHWVDESAHVWLVIYPSYDNETLLPVLYQPMEEGGTLLTPLNQRSLVSLRGMTFVDAGEKRKLYDRIKELMVIDMAGEFPIYKAWRDTAKDVLSNPVLRVDKEDSTLKRRWVDFMNGK
jgi:hypothetical protein